MAKPTQAQPQPMPTLSAKFRDNDSLNDKNNKDKKRDGQS
jgi:hypothetical protein